MNPDRRPRIIVNGVLTATLERRRAGSFARPARWSGIEPLQRPVEAQLAILAADHELRTVEVPLTRRA